MTDIEIILDCSTGDRIERPLTDAELAERASAAVEADAADAVRRLRDSNRAAIESAAAEAIATLRRIRGAGSLTNTQAQAAIKELAGNQIRLIQLALRAYDAGD